MLVACHLNDFNGGNIQVCLSPANANGSVTVYQYTSKTCPGTETPRVTTSVRRVCAQVDDGLLGTVYVRDTCVGTQATVPSAPTTTNNNNNGGDASALVASTTLLAFALFLLA